MPNTDVKRIYDLLHSPVLTPYNLLENVKLDNYFYVNYYKNEIGIVCEMKCTVKTVAISYTSIILIKMIV